MPKSRTGVLIINLGTPESPSVADVRKYLREFLMDGRVLDIPWWRRFLLVNLIIAPFRAPESSKGYQHLWTPEGSPLKVYGLQLEGLLQKALGGDFLVKLAMRYQSPSIKSVLANFENRSFKRLIVVPLYPQYASSSSGSTQEEVMRVVKGWEVVPEIKFVSRFFDHPLFIKSFVEIGKKYTEQGDFDHYLFSYHGLPEHQIFKASCDNYCRLGDCCAVFNSKNQYCYRAQCFETTRLLAAGLGIGKEKYTICFQSRLGKTPWIKPYTDEVIKQLAAQGVKRVLVFSPAFVADCLETTVEIGVEYKKLFLEQGGGHWQLVESLNVHPTWVECLKQIVLKNCHEE
ncbi:MAG: ferrochelatase [Candidatus Omnitrophica bacterium]|nr:ferrochelatase [Candidatus Omnitrophota bacterium]MDE2223426.1 ferrochelatase [Candidatus Omnitrophota bacterium]